MRLPIGILVVMLGVVLPTVLGFLWPSYSLVSNYISELGASGAPHGAIMNYAGFLPAGILWALGILSLLSGDKSKLLWAGVLLLLGTSISYIGAAVFPCDSGCPIEGSQSQMMHNALGIIGYLTSPIGLALIGLHYLRKNQTPVSAISFAAAIASIVGFLMMANPEYDSTKGAWQRLADFSLFFWLFAVSVLIRRSGLGTEGAK